MCRLTCLSDNRLQSIVQMRFIIPIDVGSILVDQVGKTDTFCMLCSDIVYSTNA